MAVDSPTDANEERLNSINPKNTLPPTGNGKVDKSELK